MSEPDMRATAILEQLYERSGNPVFVIDPFEDRILAANRASCAMLGYTRAELLATPVSHMHPAELPELQAFLERALRDGQASTIRHTCRTSSGHFLPAEMTLHAFDGGDRVLILGLILDRSEHRSREPGD